MPSLKTRFAYQQDKLEKARLALEEATKQVKEAAAALAGQDVPPQQEPQP